jgi:hypothetical protein
LTALVAGTLLWMALFVASGVRLVKAELAYYRLYEEIRQTKLPSVDEELYRRFAEEPWRLPTESFRASWGLLKVLRERQQDTRLEQARQRVVHFWWLTVAVLFLGAIVTFVLGLLSSQVRP